MCRRLICFLCVICFCSTISCRHGNLSEWPEDVSYNIDDGEVVKMDAEIVGHSYDFIRAMKFFVYSDSVLVVLNKPEENQYIVELANLKTGEVLAKSLMYGNGPLEALLNTSPSMDGNILYVKDAARRRLMSIDVDALLYNPSGYLPEVIDDYSDIPATYLTPLDENTMVYENYYCFNDKESGYVNEGQERLLFAPRGDHGTVRVGSPKYYTYNVSQGNIVPVKEKGRIFFSSSSLPLIEIYDYSGNKVKRINGPTILPVEYGIQDGSVSFRGRIPYAYLYACKSDDRVYVNYIGDYYKGSYEDLHSTVMEFDFDGRLLRSYVSPVFLSTFSVASGGIIYGQGYDETDTVVLWKLTPHS